MILLLLAPSCFTTEKEQENFGSIGLGVFERRPGRKVLLDCGLNPTTQEETQAPAGSK